MKKKKKRKVTRLVARRKFQSSRARGWIQVTRKINSRYVLQLSDAIELPSNRFTSKCYVTELAAIGGHMCRVFRRKVRANSYKVRCAGQAGAEM